MDVNLRGCFLVAQAAARRLVAAKKPGQHRQHRLHRRPAGAAAASPATPPPRPALLHLTRQMAVELARHGIRVNALAPGYIETPINRDFFASEAGQAMIRRVPQRRLGQPDDLTGPLLLLASRAGAHMTGAAWSWMAAIP